MNHFLPEESWFAFLRTLLWPLFAILIVLTAFYTFTILANILAAPFNGWLSEQVEYLETGKRPHNPLTLMQDIRQSIWAEFIKLGYFGTRAVGLFILTFIPVLNVVTPVLWFLFSAWMLAMQYMDYPLANHGITFKEQMSHLKTHKQHLLTFGSIASIMNAFPIVNFIAMPVSVITATLYRCRNIPIQTD